MVRSAFRAGIVGALVALVSCGGGADPATVRSGTTRVVGAPRTETEAPAQLEGAQPYELSIAVGDDGSALVVRTDKLGEQVAGASLIGPSGEVSPVGELPELGVGPRTLAVQGGFAVAGSTCVAREDTEEADCVSSVPVVAFIDPAGKVATSKAEATDLPSVEYEPAHDGVVAVTGKPFILYPDGSSKKLPEQSGQICGGPRGESLLLAVQDTPDDPARPEDSPGTLQGMAFDGEGWRSVGKPVRVGTKDGLRHEGDLPGCGAAMMGITGSILTGDSGWTEFPLQPADVASIVGLTASKEVAVLRDSRIVFVSPDGSRTTKDDGAAMGANLSPDGTKLGFVNSNSAQLTVTETQ